MAVQLLAEGLGKEEQALLRWEVVRRREGLKSCQAGSIGRAKPRARKPEFAAGTQQAPVMLADIKVSLIVTAAGSCTDSSTKRVFANSITLIHQQTTIVHLLVFSLLSSTLDQ